MNRVTHTIRSIFNSINTWQIKLSKTVVHNIMWTQIWTPRDSLQNALATCTRGGEFATRTVYTISDDFNSWFPSISPSKYTQSRFKEATSLSVKIYVMAQPFPVCHGSRIIEVSRSYSDTSHSVGLAGEILTRNTSKRAAVESHLRPRGHWDRR
jgi:hypothetical protein